MQKKLKVRSVKRIEYIVVHCSASDSPRQATLEAIKHLHTAPTSEAILWGKYPTHGRGWSDIGYHIVIEPSGTLRLGRPLNRAGAHTKGYNDRAIGICVVGDSKFTAEQMRTLNSIVSIMMTGYNVPKEKVVGHYELDSRKTCPNINMDDFRKTI